jgi:hypothetical protein
MSINRVCAKVEAPASRIEAWEGKHSDRDCGKPDANAERARSAPLQRLRDRRRLDVQLPNRGQRRKQNREAKGRQQGQQEKSRAHAPLHFPNLHPSDRWAFRLDFQPPYLAAP